MKKLCILIIICSINILFSCSAQKYYNQWVMIDGDNYYYDDDGKKVKNSEYKIEGNMYYFDKSGKMTSGFQNIGGTKKFFDENGKMQYGWQRINNKRYYFDKESGAMKKGWVNDHNDWYYFDDNGEQQYNAWVDDNKYYVDSNGKMLSNGYHNINGKKIYFESNGEVNYNHKNTIKKQLQVLERNAHGYYDYDQTENYRVKFYIEYDQDDSLQSSVANSVTIMSDREYVEMTKIFLNANLGGIRQRIVQEKIYDLTFYDEQNKIYDRAGLYIVSKDNMVYYFHSDSINVDLRENKILTIKLSDYLGT